MAETCQDSLALPEWEIVPLTCDKHLAVSPNQFPGFELFPLYECFWIPVNVVDWLLLNILLLFLKDISQRGLARICVSTLSKGFVTDGFTVDRDIENLLSAVSETQKIMGYLNTYPTII